MIGNIKPDKQLLGLLMPGKLLSGSLVPSIILHGSIKDIYSLIGNIQIADGYKHYDGSYSVTPDANTAVTLNTSGQVVDANITVLKVPYYETSNTEGKTVYIASNPDILLDNGG